MSKPAKRVIPTFSSSNIFLMLVYRLMLVMLLFTLCRVLFYLFNADYYTSVDFPHFISLLIGGLRFDAFALVYVNSLYILLMLIPFMFRYNSTYQKALKWLFVTTNSIAIAANCFDIIFFRFTMRRTTASIFREFGGEGNLLQLFGDFFVQYWYMVLIFAALVFILIKFYGELDKPDIQSKRKYYMVHTLLMLVGLLLSFFAMRGHWGFHNRPINLSYAAKYVKQPIEMPLVQNTPFAILKTLRVSPMPTYSYYTEDELVQIYNPEKSYEPTEPFRYKNVVIFILESFGGEFIKAYNGHIEGYVSYTPFLDSLMQHSRYFIPSYANGRKSIDGMPSVLASIPSIFEPYVLSPYSGNEINGIASLLREQGYATAFFHNAYNGSMGFDGVANLTGFEQYYGMTEYKNTVQPINNDYYDGVAGVFDEEFFQYFAQTLSGMEQPFCASLFSLSSHTPFVIPYKYRDVFKDDPDAFHSSLRYSDYALKRFFETASKMPWFENTLFVLTADHGGVYPIYDEYKTSLGAYAAPIVFYCAGDSLLAGGENRLAQQIDILPSILSYLRYKGKFVSFGNDLFNDDEDYKNECFVVQYVGNTLQLLHGDYMVHYDGERLQALYRYKDDVFFKNNLLGSLPQVEYELERKAKAFLQQYTSRLHNNALIAK